MTKNRDITISLQSNVRTLLRRALPRRAPAGSVSVLPDSFPAGRLAAAAEDYVTEARMLRHSARTLVKKAGILGKLCWFAADRCFESVGVDECRAFLLYLAAPAPVGGRWGLPNETAPLSPETSKTYFATLRAFFRWLVGEGRMGASPLQRVKAPVSRPDQIQPFTEVQVLALLREAGNSAYPVRDVAILLVLLDTGMRLGELCALTNADVNVDGREIVIRHGKGDKRRVVSISRRTARALYDLQGEIAGSLPGDGVFVSGRGVSAGDALKESGVAFLFRRLNARAKLVGVRVSPHTFRHTFAVMFLRNGGNVFTLKQILGHESLAMTNRYVAVAEADVAAQHRQFSPVEGMGKTARKK